MAKEKISQQPENNGYFTRKTTCRLLQQSEYIFIDWSKTRMLGNGNSTDSTIIRDQDWYKQKGGKFHRSRVCLCLNVIHISDLKLCSSFYVNRSPCFVALIGLGPTMTTPFKNM